jgi:hypothetical protein
MSEPRTLDETRVSDDDHEGQLMKQLFFGALVICWLTAAAGDLAQDAGQNKPQDSAKEAQPAQDAAPPTATTPAHMRLTIEVTGGTNNVAVEDASVYLKYQEERKLRKDKKYALNVKTNHDGRAHIPDPPLGKVLIQVVADGWKSYGQYYELKDPAVVIKIHLDRPPKWY